MRRPRYFQAFKELDMSEFDQDIALLTRIALFGAMVVLGFSITPGLLATISRNADVEASITTMWSMMGPANSLRNWLASLRCGAYRAIGQ